MNKVDKELAAARFALDLTPERHRRGMESIIERLLSIKRSRERGDAVRLATVNAVKARRAKRGKSG